MAFTSLGLSLQGVGPKAGTPGAAQESAPAAGATQQAAPPGSMITMLLPFLILVPFLFMSFRRQKKEQEARGKLKKGDRVVSQAGLVGELVELDDRLAKVKIAPGVVAQMLASSVSPFDLGAAAKADETKAEGATKASKPATSER